MQAIRRSLRDSWFSEASHSDGDTQVQGGGKDEAGGADSGASLMVDIQALQDCIMHRGGETASEKCAEMSAERERSEAHSPSEQASQEQQAATTTRTVRLRPGRAHQKMVATLFVVLYWTLLLQLFYFRIMLLIRRCFCYGPSKSHV